MSLLNLENILNILNSKVPKCCQNETTSVQYKSLRATLSLFQKHIIYSYSIRENTKNRLFHISIKNIVKYIFSTVLFVN